MRSRPRLSAPSERARKPLDVRAHRPWPLPPRPWVMAQRWRDLLFAHWPSILSVCARYIPEGLTLDCRDGTGVGLDHALRAWRACVFGAFRPYPGSPPSPS